MATSFTLNGQDISVDVDETTPLLWVVRDHLGMTGTKFGCGIMQCGACTMHIDGAAVRTCALPISQVAGKNIATIESLADPDGTLSPLQDAWVRHNVPQCGYCQAGMLMAASALLNTNNDPTDEEIETAVSNICRCGTYHRVREAIKDVAAEMRG